jgi:hypothetical protein
LLATLAAFAALICAGRSSAVTVPPAICAAVRKAVAEGRIEESTVLGWRDKRREFNELPAEGAVLVGFDCGVGRFMNIETVYALRAIYRTARGEVCYQDHGPFVDQILRTGRLVKTKVLRAVRVEAPPGYAVGGMTIRSGLNINGLCLVYMRIHGKRLDPRDALLSEWVGDRTGGSEHSIEGTGTPAVGILGCEDEEHCWALGLYYASEPPPPAAPPAPAAARAPVPPPLARTAEKSVAEAAPPAPAAPANESDDPPRAASSKPVPVERSARPAAGVPWLAIAVFATVTLGLFAILLTFLIRRPAQPVAASEVAPGVKDPAVQLESVLAGVGKLFPAGDKAVKSPSETRGQSLPQRLSMMAAVLAGATYSTIFAPHLFPATSGISFERALSCGVVAGAAACVGWIIGRALEIARA